MTKKEKDTIVRKSFKYKNKNDEYTLQLKHHNWWWLLLLLPLLLFVKCHKEISVTCIEPEGDIPIVGQPVELDYQAHFLLDNWHFLATDSIRMQQTTDTTGTTVFRDLPCSVFSFIFYCLQDMSLTAKSECHTDVEEKKNFHYTWHVNLRMTPRREDLYVRLLDMETKDPLPDSKLIFKYEEHGKEYTDSAFADPSGVVTIPQMRYCSGLNIMVGQCYGYADTIKTNTPCQQLLIPSDSMALQLRPLKDRFTFFVKNIETKEPIPGAECFITFKHPSGKSFGPFRVTTSIDGKGMAVYENAFVRNIVAIKAQKPPHYRDSILATGPWTVEDFIKQDEENRTIWLTPLSYMQEFINVDSITGEPIPGVKNIIVVTDHDGLPKTFTETSNRNGVFPVSAKEDSKIDIVSTKEPDYNKKHTICPTFKDADKRIPMSPVMVTLLFRTVHATKGSLLPNCDLKVNGSISRSLPPIDSENGEFEVTFRRGEELTIYASKLGYRNTTNKVTAKTWDYLQVSQERRDIPLQQDPISYVNFDHPRYEKKCYSLQEEGRTFQLDWDLCSVCTMITVMDSNGNVLGNFGINSPGGDGNGIRYTPSSGSTTLNCPTETVCVIIQSVNNDKAFFKISSD